MWKFGYDAIVTAGKVDAYQEEFLAGMRAAVDKMAGGKWHVKNTPPDKKMRLRWELIVELYEPEEET